MKFTETILIALKKIIYYNNYMMISKKKCTLIDVSKLARVSTATVSRVLNNSSSVSEDVKQRVLLAIHQLNYEKKITQKIIYKRSIGIIVPYINNPYISNLVSEVQNTLIDLEYDVIIMDSKNSPENTTNYIKKLIDYGVSGIVLIPTHSTDIAEDEIDSVKIPIVLLGRKIENCTLSFVGSEIYNGAYNGAKYLLSLGHREILFITGNLHETLNESSTSPDRECYLGFLEAINDIKVNKCKIRIIEGDYNLDKTFNETKIFLSKNNISAIFASGDVMAYGAYKAVTALGYKIPEDISIIGFDDLPLSSVMNLTSISKNSFSVGQNAGLLLHNYISQKIETPQEIIIKTNLCIRESCGINKN